MTMAPSSGPALAPDRDGEPAEPTPGGPSRRDGSGGSRRTRAARMRELRRRRRRRLLARTGAVVALLGAVLLVASVIRAGEEEPVLGPTAADRPRTSAARAPSVLLVHGAAGESAAAITLLAVAPGGEGGHVVLLPPGTMTEVPSFGLESLGRANALGGPSLVQAAVENLLGIAVDETLVFDDTGLATVVRPAGTLDVAAPGGRVQLAPDGVGPFLTDAEGVDQLALAANQAAFWRSWLAALGAQPAARPDESSDRGLGRYVGPLAAGDATVTVLPVQRVAGAADEETYAPIPEEADALVAAALPGVLALGATERTTVQILNGTGQPGLSQAVTVRLVQPPLRARVLYTGNASRFDHETTEVVYHDPDHRDAAERVRRALGAGRVVRSRQPVDIVDVVVVVGADFG